MTKRLTWAILGSLTIAAVLWGAVTTFGDFIAIPRGTAAGETGRVRFRELAAGGTHSVDLKAPDSLAATNTYTLPNAYPAGADYSLVGNTSGVMSWKNVTGGGGGGSLSPTETHTASASASIDFTTCIDGSVNRYQVQIRDLKFTNDSIFLWMRMSTDGGMSYDSSATIYNSAIWGTSASGGGAGQSNNGASAIKFMSGGPGQDNGNSVYASYYTIDIWSPASTTLYKTVMGTGTFWESNDLNVATYSSGRYKSTTAVNAFQFIASDAGTGGTIASGEFACFAVY